MDEKIVATLTEDELKQFNYYLEQYENAQTIMQQAQESWRVASGGFESFVRFMSVKYSVTGQMKIDKKSGDIALLSHNEEMQRNGSLR